MPPPHELQNITRARRYADVYFAATPMITDVAARASV